MKAVTGGRHLYPAENCMLCSGEFRMFVRDQPKFKMWHSKFSINKMKKSFCYF